MDKIFVDTDICIDLLSGRQPFNASAEILFSLADVKKLALYVSSLSFSNIIMSCALNIRVFIRVKLSLDLKHWLTFLLLTVKP